MEEALLARIRAEFDRGVDAAEAYAREQAASRERRARRNTPAGLWVLADAPDAADHAHVTTVPATPGTDLVVMSDGYARAVRPFALVADEDALLDEIVAGRAGALLDRLRAAERADPTRTRVPRFSVTDDATLLHARLRAPPHPRLRGRRTPVMIARFPVRSVHVIMPRVHPGAASAPS